MDLQRRVRRRALRFHRRRLVLFKFAISQRAVEGASPYDDSRLVLRKFAISMIESPHRFAVPSPLGKGRSVAVWFWVNLRYS